MLVEKVESGRGDGGSEEVIVRGRAVVEAIGLRVGTLSDVGTGRLRLRIEEAADMGS